MNAKGGLTTERNTENKNQPVGTASPYLAASYVSLITRARISCEWEAMLFFFFSPPSSHPMLTHMGNFKRIHKSKIICNEYKYFISNFGLLLRSTKESVYLIVK